MIFLPMALHQVDHVQLNAMDYWTFSLDNNIPVDIPLFGFSQSF